MGVLEGTSREQMAYWCLDDLVGEEAMVRVIDRFIDVTDLAALGFARMEPAETGRPPYPTPAMAKLLVYGYENAIRSSRKLERETHRNVEAMWLMGGLRPDHKTVSEFRRANIRPLQKLFREFVKLCKSWDLVGGELMAIDDSKFKASNNKKCNFSRKKLQERLKKLDEKINAYLAAMEEEDKREATEGENAPKELLALLSRKERYDGYLAQLDASGENELSTTDPDARLMGNNRGGVDVSYNVQSAVDGKHDIIADYDVSMNPSDHGRLGYMVRRLKKMGYTRFTVLADKGYFNGEDLARVKKFKIKAIVPRQNKSDPKSQPEEFHNDKFVYNPKADTYQCPMGHTLTSNNGKKAKRRNFSNEAACAACPHVAECTRGKRGYRTVTRGEYGKIYEETEQRYRENKELYKRRQQIVEHPFGTIKRALDGGYFLLRTRRKVRCEVALLFLAYNLKRAVKVLGFRGIMDRLAVLSSAFFALFSQKPPRVPRLLSA